MAEPLPASGGLTDEAALGCCKDPDPSTKVGAEPNSRESGPAVRGATGTPRREQSLGLNQASLGLDDSNSGFELHPTTTAALPALGGSEWAGKRANGVQWGIWRGSVSSSCLKDCDPACFIR